MVSRAAERFAAALDAGEPPADLDPQTARLVHVARGLSTRLGGPSPWFAAELRTNLIRAATTPQAVPGAHPAPAHPVPGRAAPAAVRGSRRAAGVPRWVALAHGLLAAGVLAGGVSVVALHVAAGHPATGLRPAPRQPALTGPATAAAVAGLRRADAELAALQRLVGSSAFPPSAGELPAGVRAEAQTLLAGWLASAEPGVAVLLSEVRDHSGAARADLRSFVVAAAAGLDHVLGRLPAPLRAEATRDEGFLERTGDAVGLRLSATLSKTAPATGVTPAPSATLAPTASVSPRTTGSPTPAPTSTSTSGSSKTGTVLPSVPLPSPTLPSLPLPTLSGGL